MSFHHCSPGRVMSIARHMLMAWNKVDCNYILRESLNGGFVEAGRRLWWSCTCAVRPPTALALPSALCERGAAGSEIQPVWCTSGGSNWSAVSVLDERLWGVQGVQVWAVYHPVTRTKLGEGFGHSFSQRFPLPERREMSKCNVSISYVKSTQTYSTPCLCISFFGKCYRGKNQRSCRDRLAAHKMISLVLVHPRAWILPHLSSLAAQLSQTPDSRDG
ncbi:uncharacterized protein LOC121357833 isoform X2 [Pyrgilauda ruficollis]|uniref:uncharacterized protein LOC121357833 isoform X2 n=1 Tax=Pyrgilauda ruficollis TaxID=221976 RepID=UPI001B87DF18|nr:uncharacterized protein LOC121357833 isoform X2 [Pyrgilauda ruficollis]